MNKKTFISQLYNVFFPPSLSRLRSENPLAYVVFRKRLGNHYILPFVMIHACLYLTVYGVTLSVGHQLAGWSFSYAPLGILFLTGFLAINGMFLVISNAQFYHLDAFSSTIGKELKCTPMTYADMQRLGETVGGIQIRLATFAYWFSVVLYGSWFSWEGPSAFFNGMVLLAAVILGFNFSRSLYCHLYESLFHTTIPKNTRQIFLRTIAKILKATATLTLSYIVFFFVTAPITAIISFGNPTNRWLFGISSAVILTEILHRRKFRVIYKAYQTQLEEASASPLPAEYTRDDSESNFMLLREG